MCEPLNECRRLVRHYLHTAQWRLQHSATRNSSSCCFVHLPWRRYRFQQISCKYET